MGNAIAEGIFPFIVYTAQKHSLLFFVNWILQA